MALMFPYLLFLQMNDPQTPVRMTPQENMTMEPEEFTDDYPQTRVLNEDTIDEETAGADTESPPLHEVELSARKCNFHSTIEQLKRNLAGFHTKPGIRFENDGKDLFPEHEVRRVLTFLDTGSPCDCAESKCGRPLTPGPRVKAGRRAVNGKANYLPFSYASDKLALSCMKPEKRPGDLLKDREIEVWKASFLDSLIVRSPTLGTVDWVRCSSPANQAGNTGPPELEFVNAQLRRRVQDLERELCEAIFRQSIAESAYQQSTLQMKELLSKLDDSSDRINELETCHDLDAEEKSEVSSQLQHTEKRVFDLRISLRKTEEENGELERKLVEAQKHIQRLSAQVQVGTKQRQKLEYEVEEEKELSKVLQQENSSLKESLCAHRKTTELFKRRASSTETAEEELRAHNSKFKRRTKELEVQLSVLRNDLKEAKRVHVELQDELWQTQGALDEARSDYEIISEEKKRINEELKAFYEHHQELKLTYNQCVHEKTEKEQQIAVLVADLEKYKQEVANLRKDARNVKEDARKEEPTPNRHERSVIEGEDLRPLPENEDTFEISVARLRSPFISDGVNPAVYFFDLVESVSNKPSQKDNLGCIQSGDRNTLVDKEHVREIESLFKDCNERQQSFEKDLASNTEKIHSLQDELIVSHQDRLETYDKLSRQEKESERLKAAFEQCKKDKRDLMKKMVQLKRRICHLKENYESERLEKRSLQQQILMKDQKNAGDRSQIRRISERFEEQNLLLDASEFGMNFI